ncbi:MAG: LysR family transcriptional regulator [Legionellales bacterium]|nr:LysR family transcriptional regulator [Legionellales bacterium]
MKRFGYIDTISTKADNLLSTDEKFLLRLHADKLGVSKSFISKKLTKLEQQLKARLIVRTTRKLILTEAGKDFYHYCTNVVQEGEKAFAMMNELRGNPSGLLKISIPPALALHMLTPLFTQFLSMYPDITLDIELESRVVDLVKEGYDLALRSTKLVSSNLIAQKIFSGKNIICATERYLAKNGELAKASDLVNHNCGVYSDSKSKNQITLIHNQHQETVFVKGNFMSNHLELIKQLVLSDTCIGFFPEFMVSNELKNKQLIRCLENYLLPTSPVFAIYPEREFMLPKLRVFLEMLKIYLPR